MLEWIVTSSSLILAVAAVRYLFRGRLSPRIQYALWAVVLIRLLLPFSLFQSNAAPANIVPAAVSGQYTRLPVFSYSSITHGSSTYSGSCFTDGRNFSRMSAVFIFRLEVLMQG